MLTTTQKCPQRLNEKYFNMCKNVVLEMKPYPFQKLQKKCSLNMGLLSNGHQCLGEREHGDQVSPLGLDPLNSYA